MVARTDAAIAMAVPASLAVVRAVRFVRVVRTSGGMQAGNAPRRHEFPHGPCGELVRSANEVAFSANDGARAARGLAHASKTKNAAVLAAFFRRGGDETRTRDLFHAMEALYQN